MEAAQGDELSIPAGVSGSFLLSCVLCLLAVAASAQRARSDLERDLDGSIPKILRRTGTPSASIAVVRAGRIELLKAFGKSSLSSARLASSNLRYPIGSISKQITAVALLAMAEDGKVRLDDRVSKYLPQIPHSSEVTVGELLSHTAGYRDDLPDNFVPKWMTRDTTPQKVLDQWAYRALDFPPGTRFEYSNTDYIIAGLLIEKLSGESLASFYADRVFRPLGMKSAAVIGASLPSDVDVTGYFRYALGPSRPAPRQPPGWLFGGGEIVMNAPDLARWDLSVLNESLLSHQSYRRLETETLLQNGLATGYGLGLRLSSIRGHRKFEHAGEVSGFYSENIQLPDDKAAVVVLTNMEAPAAATEIANAIVDWLLPTNQTVRPNAERIQKLFVDLQQGKIDRTQFSVDANDYFGSQALHDYSESLAPLGHITGITADMPTRRAGQWFINYLVRLQSSSVVVKTAQDASGKLTQFLVEPYR